MLDNKSINYERILLKFTVFCKVFSWILCHVFDVAFEDYDMSTQLLSPQKETFYIKHFKTFVRWDSLFFWEIFEKGYQFDKNHVFFPLYPLLIKFLQQIIPNFLISENLLFMIFVALIFNLALNCGNAVLFYRLSILVLGNQKLSFLSAIIFIINPASIFYTAVYTESLFTFVTLSSFYAFFSNPIFNVRGMEKDNSCLKLLSALIVPLGFLVISVFVRSNGLFFIVIPGYFLMKTFFRNCFARKIWKAQEMVFLGILSLMIILIPYFLVLAYPYFIYCSDNSEFKPPWCFEKIPNAYDYNQKEHWNVAFLEQYKLSRITFIYWGMHSLIILGLLIVDFLREKWLSFFTLGFMGEKKINSKYSELWNPFMIYTVILFIISIFFAHTQSCTRFFSSCPCFIWYMAAQIFGFQKDNEEKIIIKNKWMLIYIIYFNVAGHCMFSNYLPWT